MQWLTITNLPWASRTLSERAWYCWGLNYGDWTWLPKMTVHHPSPASRTSLKTPNYEAARPPCEDLCRQTERKEKKFPYVNSCLHKETVQLEWNFIFIHVCQEGKARCNSDCRHFKLYSIEIVVLDLNNSAYQTQSHPIISYYRVNRMHFWIPWFHWLWVPLESELANYNGEHI